MGATANGRDPGAPIAQELYAGFDKKVLHIVVFGAAELPTGQGDQADPLLPGLSLLQK